MSRCPSAASSALPSSQTSSTVSAPSAKLLLQQRVEVLPGWPTSARPIKRTLFRSLSALAIDFALLALAVSFLAFAIAVRRYDQAPTAEHIQAKAVLVRLSKLGPSIFPILFAAIIGRATHALLLWRLERGERIGTLDLLASSTSLTSTIVSHFQLRILSSLGMALLLTWALSPIGGQSSIQQLGFGNGTVVTEFDVIYLLSGSTNSSYDGSYRLNNLQTANALFQTALLSATATRNSTVDLWNNLKIPKLEAYEEASNADTEGWYIVDDSGSAYASLIGTPVYGFVPAMNESSAFKLETSYLNLDCPIVNSQQLDTSDSPWGGWSNVTFFSTFSGAGAIISLNYNASCGGEGTSATDFNRYDPMCEPPPGIYLDQLDFTHFHNLTNPHNTTPRNFTYLNWATSTASFCTVTTTYVEAEVICDSILPCKVSRLRRSRLEHRPSAYTVLDEAGGYGWSATNGNWGLLLGGFVTSISGHSGTGTALQAYLEDPDAVSRTYDFGAYRPSASANATFALRQGQLMNAYWTCISSFTAIAANIRAYDESLLRGPQNHNTTVGTKTKTFEVITCHNGWNATLILVSCILIAASLVDPVIRTIMSRSPDLMLNFSSLAARDNRYVDVPETGTAMDAAERARLMKDHRVRYGDVEATDAIGRLAISSLGTAQSCRVGTIHKGRFYI